MTHIEDSKEKRTSHYNHNIHVWDGEVEYIVAFLGATSARLSPCAGGPNITVPRSEISECLAAPTEGKCDCCGRVTRHVVLDRETGTRIFRHNHCDAADYGAL